MVEKNYSITPENRWEGITRPDQKEVERLRGSLSIEHTLARRGANRLWHLLHNQDYVHALGAMSGNQAMQMVRAGLQAIYVSGWQVAADANLAGEMYPDQSLYPSNSVPTLVKKINSTLQRADQIEHSEGKEKRDWYAPLVADAEAGFGGPLNAYELMKSMIEAGAAGVHYEDQLASEKKCGHMGGKVLVPASQFIRTLKAARLAADVMDVPTLLIARTDAESAKLITSEIDKYNYVLGKKEEAYDAGFISEERTEEGYFRLREGTELQRCVARGLAYAPYADLIWMETSTPDLEQAEKFAKGIRAEFPNKMLAYNCSPSFNWVKNFKEKYKLTEEEAMKKIGEFQQEIGTMGYKFQFVTLAGFHALNHKMFELARDYKTRGMGAYAAFQQEEFASEEQGYTATRHQREVGTGYFDEVQNVIKGETAADTTALDDSTEKHQF